MVVDKMVVDAGGIKRIHALLSKIGMANDKEYKLSLIRQYTNDRETSTKRLYIDEAGQLINDLQRVVDAKMSAAETQADRKRKLILHYAHQMMWEIDVPGGRPKVDIDRVNGWCVKYGYLHKPFMDYKVEELSKLVVQMERVYKDVLKAV